MEKPTSCAIIFSNFFLRFWIKSNKNHLIDSLFNLFTRLKLKNLGVTVGVISVSFHIGTEAVPSKRTESVHKVQILPIERRSLEKAQDIHYF